MTDRWHYVTVTWLDGTNETWAVPNDPFDTSTAQRACLIFEDSSILEITTANVRSIAYREGPKPEPQPTPAPAAPAPAAPAPAAPTTGPFPPSAFKPGDMIEVTAQELELSRRAYNARNAPNPASMAAEVDEYDQRVAAERDARGKRMKRASDLAFGAVGPGRLVDRFS